jgi:plasmid maintenance system antidote protein VapI
VAVLTDTLRKAIDEADVTLYRLAKDAGLDFSAVSRFYHGERSLTLESADKLAEYFNLEVKQKGKSRGKK